MRTLCGCACAMLALSAAAHAGQTIIDISSLVNEPWTFVGPSACAVSNGSTFPTGYQNFGGVPLSIPSGPNNTWLGCAAANYGSGTVSLTIPVGISGVTSAFTLVNSMWGQYGPQSYLSITFNGSGGATYTQPLAGNVNVRDYNNDGGDNAINNTTTVQVWDNGMNQRLDRQEYIMPASFASQVLSSVTITDTGNEGFSRAIFSGLTVSTCESYVAANIHVTPGKILYHPRENIYTQRVTLTNAGTQAVNGPLFLVLEDLPAGVELVHQAGQTHCWAPIGSPYVFVLPEGSSLAPGTTAVILVGYRDPSGAAISYMPLAIVSQGATP